MREDYDQEINIMYIIWELILRWRSIILAGIICAILVGSIKYYKDYQSYRDNKQFFSNTNVDDNFHNEILNKYNLTSIEANQAECVYNTKVLIDNYMDYIGNSPLFVTNANSINAYQIKYYIKIKNSNNFTSIVSNYPLDNNAFSNSNVNSTSTMINNDLLDIFSLYESVINSQDFINEIEQYVNTENKQLYLNDIIRVDANESKDVVVFNILKLDGVDYKAIADKLIREINKSYNNINALLPHSITKCGEDDIVIGDTRLLNDQYKLYTVIKTLTDQEKNMEDALADNQKAYLDMLKLSNNALDGLVDNSKIMGTSYPSLSKKYVAIGFIIGIFIICCYYLIIILFSSKLQEENQILEMAKISSFGIIKSNNKKKKPCMFIDKWLDLIRYKNVDFLSIDEAIDKYAKDIKLALEVEEKSSVSIIGSVLNNNQYIEIAQKLSNKLMQLGIYSNYVGSVSKNSLALENAIKNNCVVLLEYINESKKKEIETELRKAYEYKLSVLGEITIM